MAHKTSSFERFWKELKRRKVIHVITVYAAVAFVILQLVDMVSQPLHFPDWTQGFIIVLLCIGFIIAIFLSWVYDITPSGVRKTKPLSAAKHTDHATTPASSGWKIATYVSGVIIVALVAFNFISRRNLNSDITKLEKSIAVLPFYNDSPSDSTTYFINGLMEEILNNLHKIRAFSKVLARSSVEQYRGSVRPTIQQIGKELDVNFIVEGSGQKYGNTFHLRVQLIETKNGNHLWAESYEKEIRETKDIIETQSQIAQAIAAELKATITPEEKRVIEKTPTTSLTAYDFYQRGREELTKVWSYGFDHKTVKRAETLFHKALEYDSTFAQAYVGLAEVFFIKRYKDNTISENNILNNYLDSMLVLANTALSYDDYLPGAYIIRAAYYTFKGYTKKTIEEYDKAIRYNPNDYFPYFAKGGLYEELDILKSLENIEKAASLNHGPELTRILTRLGHNYYMAGFPAKGNYFLLEVLTLDGDSVKYSDNKVDLEAIAKGNYKKAIEHYVKRYLIDSTNTGVLDALGLYYSFLGQHKESLKYYKKSISILKASGQTNPTMDPFIGYAYLQNGYRKESEYYFERLIEAFNNRIKSVPPSEKIYWVYPLAGIYACRGDKDKAYENLKVFNQNESFTLMWVTSIKNNPLFDSIRNEPEFQQIVRDVEAKYQKEHERVRKWLEEQGML
jgi:TolB-like protein/tetratricopeptide (TPR) repeat protein